MWFHVHILTTRQWLSCPAQAALCLLFWLLVSVVQAADPQPSIVVEGVSGEERKNIEALLTLPTGIWQEGRLDEILARRIVRQAPRRVREALEPFGFYHPEVRAEWKTDETGMSLLSVWVDPGDPVLVGDVLVRIDGQGAHDRSLRDKVETFPLRKGDVLRHDRYDKAKEDLLKKAVALGYLDAAFSIHAMRISLERRLGDIELVLHTGTLYRFGEAVFQGLAGYPEPFLRRYITFKPGEAFSYDEMARTQANYVNADRFREVVVNIRKEAAREGHLPVEIGLSPGPTKSVRLGAGYGTDTGPRATLRYRDVNTFDQGQEWHAEAKISPVFQGISSRYLFPSRRDWQTYTALSAGAQREDLTDYVSKLYKVEMERVYGFADSRVGSVFLQARGEESHVGEQVTNTFLLMPGIRFSAMHYDDPIRPRKGFQYQVEIRGTHPSLGSSTGFLQSLASADTVIPLPLEFALIGRARVGGTWQNDPSRDLPVSVRFFAGGDRSVRGYGYQALGPVDSKGTVVGGRNLLVGAAELERYIGRDWGAAIFYDVGNAFDNLNDWSAAKGAGFGIRYYSPIGPIKFDVARQLDVPQPDTRIHLTIGVGL